MSNIIVNPKTYSGRELETIFFRPLLTGPSAEALGIRILYNMPMPTVVQIWDNQQNVLTPFDKASGWSGGTKSTHYQKTIPMSRVKAENSFAASDYFSTVFEMITNRSDVNMEDLSGTELEAAETELFRRAIAESIRMNMWLGDKDGALNTGFESFDGLLKIINARVKSGEIASSAKNLSSLLDSKEIGELFSEIVSKANPRLKGLYAEGQVAFFVSPRVYALYQNYLDSAYGSASYQDCQSGRAQLAYHGFPVIEINLEPYIGESGLSEDFIIFADRRNLALAVNTSDSPGSEIRMWYNPDEMENRQRAVFAIGCEVLDEELVSAYIDAQ